MSYEDANQAMQTGVSGIMIARQVAAFPFASEPVGAGVKGKEITKIPEVILNMRRASSQ